MEAQEKSPGGHTLDSQKNSTDVQPDTSSFPHESTERNGTGSDTLTAALYYHDHDCYVVPCCTMDEQGACSFPHTHDTEKSIGKRPICGDRWQDLRLTREGIIWWWTRYPTAGVGVLLEPSRLMVVDLDSDDATEEASRKGLPPGPQVRAGRGVHHYFRNPKNIIGLTIKRGESRSIDVLSKGIVIGFGSLHRSGKRYKLLTSWEEWPPEEPPLWAETLLLESLQKRGDPAGFADDLPPVDLEALQIPHWLHDVIVHGQPTHGEPYPSRSEAVWAVVTALVQAGHETATIASILLDPRFQISEKPRAQGPRWLAGEIGRARAKTTEGEKGPQWEEVNTGPEDPPKNESAWPEPLALPDALLPVLPFDERLLPAPLHPWLSDIADRMQCPLDFPAIGALIGIASIVGRRVGIYPKRQDDWLVIPNLWGAVIGRPGLLKTPALAEVLKPLKRLEMAARKTYEEDMRIWQAKVLIRKLSREEQEKKIKAAIRAGENVQEAAETLLKEEEAPGPVLRRYLVNDCTVEKLGVILNENPDGTLVFRDELTGWLYTLEKEGHENDRTFYLEAWNGDGSYTYDRIGRGTIFIPAVCVSLLGGIQPSRLAEYLRATMHGGADDDGLMQRFQLAVYPDSYGAWRNVDTWPDSAAKQQANRLFDSLDALSPSLLGISRQEGERVPAVRFNYEAQEFFNEWRHTLETKLRGGQLHPALESHLSKYRSLMPSLALLFFLLDLADGKVSTTTVPLASAHLAAAWTDFLEMHAHRIYSGVTEHALFSARLLSERIPQGALPNPFTLRMVLRKQWSGLGSLEDVREAVDLLEESNWVRAERVTPHEKGGRPSVQYWVNPRVFPQKEKAE